MDSRFPWSAVIITTQSWGFSRAYQPFKLSAHVAGSGDLDGIAGGVPDNVAVGKVHHDEIRPAPASGSPRLPPQPD